MFKVKFSLRFRASVGLHHIQDPRKFRILKVDRPVIVIEKMTERPVHQRLQKILLRHFVIHENIGWKGLTYFPEFIICPAGPLTDIITVDEHACDPEGHRHLIEFPVSFVCPENIIVVKASI